MLRTCHSLCSLFPSSLSVSLTHESSCSCSLKTISTTTTYRTLHAPYTFTLFNSKFIKMASPRPALESPSGEGTTNILRSDCPSADDLGCLDTSSNTFSIDLCNIRGLRSNFQFVKHHLSSTKPHLLFLTETQLSVATDSRLFSVPSYFLYPHF